MGYDAVKLELIEWLTKLEDEETIHYLKVVKDNKSNDSDWWNDISDYEKRGIERGIKDIEEGRTVSHDEVKLKYGL